ncbi:response regulator transcription factor [Acidipropionibacterium jensenii]|uniref:response regulator transcription factor n=1 Tax=Acidipropionibacterium jensenii TaxID=1749 RepID=UPI000BC31A45|nr:response regulator transcription factor [Acidipropionibacterium jensenii]
MGKLRILVVDDDPVLREGLAALLRFDQGLDTEVVGTARDGQEALVRCIADPPDVVVMDIRMPRMNGIEATRRIVREHPEIKVLALTTFTTQEYVAPMLAAGASGYLVKDSTDELVGAVQAVLTDEFYISPKVSSVLVRMAMDDQSKTSTASPEACGGPGPDLDPPTRHRPILTDREEESVRWLAHGYSNAEIASAMGVSVGSIKGYLARAAEKMGVRDRVQLLILATQLGMVTPRIDDEGL